MRSRAVLVPLIIAINTLVFIAWNFYSLSDPYFMINNFLVSWNGLTQGRYWTLITSVFSHNLFIHFFINMFVLNSFGNFLESVLGIRSFLSFYLIAGFVSSLSHCLVSNFILDSPDIPALGASGAVAGLVLLFSLMFPKQKLLIFGIIPVPALFGAAAFIALDLWGLLAQARGGGLPIGHGAHLGGALTGIIYYFAFIRKKPKRFI